MLRNLAAWCRRCRSSARHLASIFLATACIPLAHAGALWFSDAQGLHRLDTATNAITANIAQSGIVALTLEQKDGSLWAVTSGQLFKYGASGAPVLAIDLKSLSTNFNAARRLVLDPSDDSVWVAGGNNAFHLDAAGHVVASVSTNVVVQDIALAQDGSLWVLGRSILTHYSAQGGVLASANLANNLQQAAFLVLDDANGTLWLAGAKSVDQLALALPVQINSALATSEVVSGIALDSGTGTLWVAGQSSIFSYTRDAALSTTMELASQNLGNFRVLDFDAPSQSLWLGHEKGISRFTSAGQYVATLPASVKVDAISAAPSGIVPIVTLVSPADGALTRNAFEPIRLHYDASCFGQPCNFPPIVLAAYSLTAVLDGQSIGGAFVFDPTTDDAVFTPGTRYAEGANSFSAYVTDSSGRRSKPVAAQFTVDTIPPHFVSVTPADGFVFLSPAITLQGSVDDILGSVLLENFSGATVTGANPQGQVFSYGITLQPGVNSFRLAATDPAGNATALSLAYTYSTLTLTITSPHDGATIDDNQVVVAGTFAGSASATITVNGVGATVSGNTFTTTVPLHFGSNTLNVSGTSAEGAHATQTLTVTSTFPSIALASPAPGASIPGNNTLVYGSIQAPPNSGVVVNGVAAAVDANGNFDAVVPLGAGANSIAATVTTLTRKSSSATVTVNATGQPPAIVASASPVSGIAPLAVTFTVTNPTANDATFMFDTFGSFALPAGSSSSLSVTYPAGVFTPAIVATDSLGNVSAQSFVIQSIDTTQMDALLRSLWSGMTNALVAGDKPTAMAYLDAGAQLKYGSVFDALLPNFAAIVPTYSAPQMGSIGDQMAEYAVGRTVHGQRQVFLIYFLRDVDGVWRIGSM